MEHTVVDAARLQANSQLDPDRRAELGQFMTSAATSTFMAGLFSAPMGPVRLLDAGAGVGSLAAAFIDRFPQADIHAEAWEVDPVMRRYLVKTLARYRTQRSNIHATIFETDFIHDAVRNLKLRMGARYTHAIQNPPYAKINSMSEHRSCLREVGIETVNLYTAFVALTILLMESQGEIVAIIPRSFCNGTYYRPFRELLLNHCAIRQLHLFESRRKTFADDAVLQENIIIHLVKNGQQGEVTVTTSHGPKFDHLPRQDYSFTEIVKPGDPERFIHVPSPSEKAPRTTSCLFSKTLTEIGLEVRTGPVVDFRLKQATRRHMEKDTVPLLYPHHFQQGKLSWPREHKKPNAIVVSPESKRWLMPTGWYVIVKRFSSKEEKRRIVSYIVDPGELPGKMIGFENHWNVFHVGKEGLDPIVARGLTVFLNSTVIDDHFRVFSGHTQVNATDLRNMKYPTLGELRVLGKLAGRGPLTQMAIDALIEKLENNSGDEESKNCGGVSCPR